jgi:hypothetical protein
MLSGRGELLHGRGENTVCYSIRMKIRSTSGRFRVRALASVRNHELALIVTGRSTSLDTWTFLGNFLGPTVDDKIRAWNLTPHSGVWFSTNLPSGIRKSAPRRLGLDFLDFSFSLTLFGPSTSPHPFLAIQPLAVFSPLHIPTPT